MNHNVARGRKKGEETEIGLYSGPIPPPELLSSYEQVDSTLPTTIMLMATDEQSHRHDQDKKNNRTERAVMRSDAIIRFLIPILATLVALSVLAVAVYAFYKELENIDFIYYIIPNKYPL